MAILEQRLKRKFRLVEPMPGATTLQQRFTGDLSTWSMVTSSKWKDHRHAQERVHPRELRHAAVIDHQVGTMAWTHSHDINLMKQNAIKLAKISKAAGTRSC